MKVLWFSNSSAAAYEEKIKGTGGWMEALDTALQTKVELHVASLYPSRQEVFVNGRTCYHPIYSGNIILKSIKQRLRLQKKKDYLKQYLDIVEQVKPDIIHIHGTENSFHQIIDKIDIPVVVSIQGNLTVYAHKFFSGFHGKYLGTKTSKLNVKSLFLGRTSFRDGYENMRFMCQLEQRNLMHARYIIGRTDWDKRITRILAPNSQYFVGNEILRDSFYQNIWKSKMDNNKIVIHTTNSNNYYKGFETLCYALSLLNSIGVDVEWRVAGVNADSAIVKITKKMLGSKYPKKGLVLLGSLQENELVRNLMAANMYVMVSHIENSPNNLCEAMILGMPCLATLAGGTNSILKDKEEGIIIQYGDPWSMAGAILELHKNPKMALKYGERARITALKRHDKETIVNNLIQTYEIIIKETKCTSFLSAN